MAHIYKTHKPQLEGKDGQISLVEASGADRGQVNQWISGAQKTIRIDHALRIEAKLGYSHVWLMTGIGDPIAVPGQVIVLEVEPPPLLTLATPQEMRLLNLFRGATDEAQLDIFSGAEAAAKRPAAKIRRGKT